MTNNSIESIIINLENNKTIIADNKLFSNLYISNIDENGDEIPYKESIEDTFISNFFMIKLKNKIIEYNLTNKYLEENAFDLINSNNIYHTFKEKNDLCIVQSEYDIKYYENLFV